MMEVCAAGLLESNDRRIDDTMQAAEVMEI
jgi:hypothetical protein